MLTLQGPPGCVYAVKTIFFLNFPHPIWVTDVIWRDCVINLLGVRFTFPSVFSCPSVQLLGVEASALRSACLTKTIIVNGEKVRSPLSLEEATYGRDAMGKSIYDRLFSWLVATVNRTLEVKRKDTAVIGLLDIYGFEVFKKNRCVCVCVCVCFGVPSRLFP